MQLSVIVNWLVVYLQITQTCCLIPCLHVCLHAHFVILVLCKVLRPDVSLQNMQKMMSDSLFLGLYTLSCCISIFVQRGIVTWYKQAIECYHFSTTYLLFIYFLLLQKCHVILCSYVCLHVYVLFIFLWKEL